MERSSTWKVQIKARSKHSKNSAKTNLKSKINPSKAQWNISRKSNIQVTKRQAYPGNKVWSLIYYTHICHQHNYYLALYSINKDAVFLYELFNKFSHINFEPNLLLKKEYHILMKLENNFIIYPIYLKLSIEYIKI